MAEGRSGGRSLLVVSGSGLLGAGLAAVAGGRAWVEPDTGSGAGDAVAQVAATAADASSPLTTALALVVLAGWGVVLVTRGRFRLVVAVLVAVASVGLLVAAVSGFVVAPQALADLLALYGVSDLETSRTWWPWVAVAGALLATGAGGLGLRRVRGWPEMGRRYDAPAAAAVAAASAAPVATDSTDSTDGPDGADDAPAAGEGTDPADADNLGLWKALDEGRDPTV